MDFVWITVHRLWIRKTEDWMMHPKYLDIADYDYPLSPGQIALHPLPSRDSSKLLIWQNRHISEDLFSSLPGLIPSGSLMVFNNTRVMEARLRFRKPTGGQIEIFCLEPAGAQSGPADSLNSTGPVRWNCLVGKASSWNPGLILEKEVVLDAEKFRLSARLLSKNENYFVIEFSWDLPDCPFSDVLHAAGHIPLPPYIKREADAHDQQRYQTVYAVLPGSVAAPTAGLHFTTEVLERLREKKIDEAFVTLHVGAGTFMPVKSATMEGHAMHAEYIDVSLDLLESLQSAKPGSVIAVGTTSLRTLESLYWLGKKMLTGETPAEEIGEVQQWDPYDDKEDVPVREALTALIDHLHEKKKRSFITRTGLLIAPGYRFRLTDILITNFHQPRSTLLLLVAAFIGEDWRTAYTYALNNKFRFLSYGDACLLFRQ